MSVAFDFVAYLSILVGTDLGWGPTYENSIKLVAVQHWVNTAPLDAMFLHKVLIADPIDWPPASDLSRFKVTLGEAWRKSTHCTQSHKYLTWNKGIFPWPKHATDCLLEDLEWRGNCWGNLALAIMHAENGCTYDARQWLQELRQILDDDDYESGRLPDHLPPGVMLPPYFEWSPVKNKE